MASSVPADFSEGNSSSHTAALRNLSREIAYFNDPEIRARLATLPVQGNLSRPEPAPYVDPAELHASVLSLRAELSCAVTDRDTARADAQRSAEHAKCLEEDVNRLRRELDSSRTAAGAQEHALRENIKRLEHERMLLAEDSAEKTALLRQRSTSVQNQTPTQPPSSPANVPNGTMAASSVATVSPLRHQESITMCERLKKQLDQSKAELTEVRSAHKTELKSRDERLRNLERDVVSARSARSEADAALRASQREHATKEAALRADLVAAKAELSARTDEVVRVRTVASRMESKLSAFEVEKKVKENTEKILKSATPTGKHPKEASSSLQSTARTAASAMNDESTDVTIVCLKAEVEQLSTWVRAISPTGSNLEEGLAILREAAAAAIAAQGSGQTGQTGSLLPKLKNIPESSSKSAAVSSDDSPDSQSNAPSRQQQQHKIALARLNHRVNDLMSRLTEAENEGNRLTLRVDELSKLYSRSERLRQLLEKKSEHLQKALADIELCVEKDETDPTHMLARLQERVKAAEDSAAAYKNTAEQFDADLKSRDTEIRSLKMDISFLRKSSDAHRDNNETVSGLRSQLMTAIREAATANEQRETEKLCNTKLSAEIDELRSKLSSAHLSSNPQTDCVENLDYNPDELKVVRLKSDLTQAALPHEFGTENRVAKRARTVKEHDDSQRHRESTLDSVCTEHSDLNELEEKLEELQKRNAELERLSKVGERTKEIAKRKIDEVRHACCSLFGWTLRITGATYKLSSIYAEGQEDELLFGMGEGGAVSLLENGYTAKISDEVEQLVNKWNSIPALLASITLSNFEKTTVLLDTGS